MKSEFKKLPQSEVELKIAVPYEDYKRCETQAISKLNRELKIDGFRAGHIPEPVIRERVGEEGLKSAALELLLPQTYARAVKEHQLQVIAPPEVKIERMIRKEGDELQYTARVAVMPEVKVGDYKKIKVERKKPAVTEKQVSETLEKLLNRFADWREVKRPAQKGDRAELNFEGFDPKTRAAVSSTKSANHPVILGSATMVPGFEEAVLGMSPSATKEFEITFPKKYHASGLQGKRILFKVTLNRLEEKRQNELDPALIARMTGQKQSVEEFKKRVEADLVQEMTSRAERDHENQVVQEIIKITKVELPEALVKDEINHLLEEKKQEVGRQGLTWEQYLQHIRKTEDDFKKEHRDIAEERLKARLAVQHIIREAGIQASIEEVGAKIKAMEARYPASEHQKIRQYYQKGSEGYRMLEGNIAADKLIAMLSK